jgi:hypothetical protein
MTISFHKIATLLRMLFNSFIHITETEWRITRKVFESSNKKHTVHRVSGNIGTTNCTVDRVTKILHDFFQAA